MDQIPIRHGRRAAADSGAVGAVTDAVAEAYDRLHVPRSLNYPTTTLGRLLDQSAERFGDTPAVIYGNSNPVRWTYRELHQRVNRAAGGLAVAGLRGRDRVLLMLPNCPEYIVCFLAVQKLGAVVVNAGPLIGADDLRLLIQMTEPKIIVALDLQAPHLDTALDGEADQLFCLWVSLMDYQWVWQRLGYRLKRWQARHAARNGAKTARQATWSKLIDKAPPRPPTVLPAPDDIAVLQPTGGTTGSLKVAQISHRNLLANATQLSVWSRLQFGQEKILAILPMFHVYGLTIDLVTAVFSASTILPVTRFRVGDLLETIRCHRPTVVPLVPAIFDAICDVLSKDPQPELCELLRRALVTSGAAPLGVATAQRFEELTGVRIVQGYGLTEASPVTHSNPADESRPLSIGLPLPDTQTRIVDPKDHSQPVEAGEPGELLVCGPQVFHGYLDDPVESRKVLCEDDQGRRWLRTGDVVRVDDQGFFEVVDRTKHMINRGGLKVYPARVEQVLLMHRLVADAAVIGRADPRHTEVVVAVVVLADKQANTEQLAEELRALCREHLARYEVPALVEFIDELPRTALGKLQKHRIPVNGDGQGIDRDTTGTTIEPGNDGAGE